MAGGGGGCVCACVFSFLLSSNFLLFVRGELRPPASGSLVLSLVSFFLVGYEGLPRAPSWCFLPLQAAHLRLLFLVMLPLSQPQLHQQQLLPPHCGLPRW